MIKDSQKLVEGIHYATGKQVRVEISDGFIHGITETGNEDTGSGGLFIAPGLIDNQINGYANIDFSGNDLTPDGFLYAARQIWKSGVTTFLPTLITNSHDNLVRNFSMLKQALERDDLVSGSVPGFHLEGPYISPGEGYRGCHPVQYIRKPSLDEFGQYQKAAGGKIIHVTIAPEVDGAQEFIRYCAEKGIIVAMGHTNSDASQVAMAAESGARLSTHLGNGCANMIHRHYNPIWPQLADERLIPTIIADGFHLLPEELKVFLKVKGVGNLILTSDVMFLAGMAPGKYTFMESEVLLTEEGMLRNIEMNCLAGASFPLSTGVGNMMKYTGCSLEDAVTMASGNASRLYGLSDRGSLETGKRADMILFEIMDHKVVIRKTYLSGRLVFSE